MAIDEKGRYTGKLIGADDTAQIGSAERPAVIEAKTITASGAITASGGVTGAVTGTVTGSASKFAGVNLAVATPKVLTAAESGQVFVGVVDCAFTLPSAATAGNGAHYHIITGVASAGAGVTVVRAGSDTIDGRVSPTGATITAAATLTNTAGTDVKGDSVWLVSDGVSKWTMIGITGVWAGS